MNAHDRDEFVATANTIESDIFGLQEQLRNLRVKVAGVCSPGEHDIHAALHSAEMAITTAVAALEGAIARLGQIR